MARLSVLLALWLTVLVAPALAQICDVSWTNPSGGDWDTASNWNRNHVPTASDQVCVTLGGSYTVTASHQFAVYNLRLGGGGGTQTLVVSDGFRLEGNLVSTILTNGVIEWTGGTIYSRFTQTHVNHGLIRLTGPATNRRLDLRLRNEGTVRHAGSGSLGLDDAARIENAGLWDFTANGSILPVPRQTSGTFVNEADGTIRKSLGLGTTVLDGFSSFTNEGTVSVLNGTIQINVPSTHTEAVLRASAGATLRLTGDQTFVGAHGGAIGGTLEIAASNITAGFILPGVPAVWDFTNEGVDWTSGTLTGGWLTNTGLVHLTGETTSRGVRGSGHKFRNEGTVEHESSGVFKLSDIALVENAGIWDLLGTGGLTGGSGVFATFSNEAGGVFRKLTAGVSRIKGTTLRFENAGTVRILSGELEVTSSFDHRSGASIDGNGVFDVAGSDVIHNGDTVPSAPGAGGGVGLLTWQGDYTPSETSTFFAEINWAFSSHEQDQISVTGDAVLAGTLHVTLLGGYVPPAGIPLRLISCTGTCSGTFDSVVLPPGLDAEVQYSPQGVYLVVAGYSVTHPAAGARWSQGERYTVRWSGSSVPDASQYVLLSLDDGTNPPVQIARVKNKGSFRYTVPATVAPGATYRVRVDLDGTPTTFGFSDLFTIFDPYDALVVTSPVAGETFAQGTNGEVRWTLPEGSSDSFRLTLFRGAEEVSTRELYTAGTGYFSYPIPSNQTVGANYSFTVEDTENPLFFGRSETFAIGPYQVTRPAANRVWEAGYTELITWAGPNLSLAGTLKVILKRNGFPGTTLATNVPYGDGSVTVTVPSVPDAADYFVRLVYTLGAAAPITVNSLPLTVTGGAAPVAGPPSHFGAPAGVEDWTELVVSAPSLADGAEVAAFAGDLLLGMGRVEAGTATVWVAGTYVDSEGDAASVAPGAELRLRAYVDGAEEPLEASAVTSGMRGEATALSLSVGDVLFVSVGGDAAGAAPLEAAAGALPAVTALLAPAPNPSAGRTSVRFDLAESSAVRVAVYDALGREVALLVDEIREPGHYETALDTSRLAPGVYLVRLTAGGFAETRRLTVTR